MDYGFAHALRVAENKFRQVLGNAGDGPLPVFRGAHVERHLYRDELEYRVFFGVEASYRGTPSGDEVSVSPQFSVEWVLSRYEVEECRGGAPAERDLRSLYSRLYEDALMERQLKPHREYIEHLTRIMAPPEYIRNAHEQYRRVEQHIRQHHRAPEPLTPLPYREPNPQLQQMADELRRMMDAQFLGAATLTAAGVGMFRHEVGTEAAQKKGLDLLRSWLTPEQNKQYDEHQYFEVIGSRTGKRYRIRHGRQMNIEEIDDKGKRVRGICTLPEGGLVAGDCMLAQKIALETFEDEALKTANKFA